MLYAKIMLDYANYAHPENLPSTVRYGCRRYGQGWWPQTRRKKGVKKGTYRASSGERTRTRHLRAKTVRTGTAVQSRTVQVPQWYDTVPYYCVPVLRSTGTAVRLYRYYRYYLVLGDKSEWEEGELLRVWVRVRIPYRKRYSSLHTESTY